MMIKNKIYLILTLAIIWGCSTKKNTWMRRNYHNLTAHYNVFFNGKESFKSGVKNIQDSNEDKYTNILNVFPESKESNKDVASGDMDIAIEKGTKLIKKHSIRKKPKKREGETSVKYQKFISQNEFNKWVDNAYLLIGKAQFHKHEFYASQQTFAYIFREFEPGAEYYEAEIWNARAAIEQGDYSKAKVLLENYNTEGKAPEKLYGFFSATYADYYLRQQMFKEAIPFLEEAIEGAWSRYYKLRLTFIIAQVYQKLNMYTQASNAYKDVIKMNPPYEMSFNAKVNRASVMFGEGGLAAVKKEIAKLLRDKRNIEYQDQIYYALAKAYQAEEYEKEAIDNFLTSVEKSTDNNYQKGLSFYELSNVYYQRPEYKPTYNYLDSAVLNLDNNFPDLENVKELHKDLSELVKHIDNIEREDSLQRVALMSEMDRLALIEKLISEEKEKIKEEKEREEAGIDNDFFYNDSYTSRTEAQKGGKWYFYNVNAVGMGKQEFEKRWGRRKLEDNWRRANKEVVAVSEEEGEIDMPGDPFTGDIKEGGKSIEKKVKDIVDKVNDESKKENMLNKSAYLKDLPLTEEALQKSNALIEEGLLNSGIIYKDKLENIPFAIDAFNELIKRFPNTKHLEDVLMNLYLCYEIQGDKGGMASVKSRLDKQFPEAEFTAFLNDPDYFVKRAERNSKIEQLYQEAYKNYLLNDFDSPIVNYNKAIQIDEESELLPKFKLVAGLSNAKSGDLSGFEKQMKEIVDKHKESDVFEVADKLLKLYNEGRTPVKGPVSSNLIETREKLLVKEKIEEKTNGAGSSESLDYEINTKAMHSLFIIANNKADLNRLVFNVADYNFSKFLLNDYEIARLNLPDATPMVAVSGFNNSSEALDYFYSIRERGDIFEVENLDSYEMFVINAGNRELLVSSGDTKGYLEFFNANYLTAEGIKAGLNKAEETKKVEIKKEETKNEDKSVIENVVTEEVKTEEQKEEVQEEAQEESKGVSGVIEEVMEEENQSSEVNKEVANPVVNNPEVQEPQKSNEFIKEDGAHSAMLLFKKGRINIQRIGTMFTNYAKINAGPEYKVTAETKGAAYFYVKVDGFNTNAEAKTFLDKMVLNAYIMREVSRMNPYKWVISENNFNLLSTEESFKKYDTFYKTNY